MKFSMCAVLLLLAFASAVDGSRLRMFQDPVEALASSTYTSSGARVAAMIDAWSSGSQDMDTPFACGTESQPGVPPDNVDFSSTAQDHNGVENSPTLSTDNTYTDNIWASVFGIPLQEPAAQYASPPTAEPQAAPLPDDVTPKEQDQEPSPSVPDETPTTEQEANQAPAVSQDRTQAPSTQEPPAAQDIGDAAGSLQDVLDTHNSFRARYGVPLLSWSGSIATSAQSYSQNCVFEHSQTKGLGENLSLGHRDWAAAIKAWMEDEEGLYDWNNPGFTRETGHFTQVIWKTTTQMGCGSSPCSGSPLYVCQYSPPGNVIGDFEANVLRPRAA